MPFEIVRNDLVNMRVDAIVNTTNPQPVIGYGVDSGIHQKAGPKLLAARQRLGKIAVGDAGVTPAYDLEAKYVIHTVCPVWQDGKHGEAELLRRCYDRALELARRKWCRSVAFPLMAAGNHGFPKEVALQTAVNAISAFLMKHEMQIYLVVFSESAVEASGKLFKGIASYIDARYVREKSFRQYGVEDKCLLRQEIQENILPEQMRRRRLEALETQLREMAEAEEEYIVEDVFYEVSASAPAPMDDCGWSDDAQDVGAQWKEENIGTAPPCQPAPPPLRSCEAREAPARHKAAFRLPTIAPAANLKDMLKNTDEGFSETLLRLIDKTGKKDSEIYKKANIDRKLFSKIRNNRNYQPSKPTAVAFAIALEMDLDQTRDFLARAGYALSHSSKFDIIIEYCILNKNYNVHEINMILFEFDQTLLGC